MNDKTKLVLVFTDTEIVVTRIKYELEMKGINSIIKDDFKSGISAGFSGGLPSGVELFVEEKDVEMTSEIINALLSE